MTVSFHNFMKTALNLAKKGLGLTSPNPAVGAIVVKNNRVIGKGHHMKAGLPHAEVLALRSAGKGAKEGDLYVTLEPCVHYGKTPPCVDAIIKAGIRRVFIGMKDPNPKVNGKGISKLKRAGIKVEHDILREQCLGLNESYIKYITKGMPFVILKLGATLDGRIGTQTGGSEWITSLEARRRVHRIRSLVDCVMAGAGTILKDDPRFTVRLIKGRNPARAVLDTKLKVPLNARFFDSKGERLFVFTGYGVNKRKVEEIEKKGASLIKVPKKGRYLHLESVLKELAKKGITSVMLEGGSALSASALKEGLVDKAVFFIAPKILGSDAIPSIGRLGIKTLNKGKVINLKRLKVKTLGKDIMVEGYIF